MLDYGNYGGVLMYLDIPIGEFKYVDNQISFIKAFDTFTQYSSPVIPRMSDYCLRNFLDEQIVPQDRIKLLEDLPRYSPIRSYNPEQILRWHNGCNCANSYWVQEDSDRSCWPDMELYKRYEELFPRYRWWFSYPAEQREQIYKEATAKYKQLREAQKEFLTKLNIAKETTNYA